MRRRVEEVLKKTVKKDYRSIQLIRKISIIMFVEQFYEMFTNQWQNLKMQLKKKDLFIYFNGKNIVNLDAEKRKEVEEIYFNGKNYYFYQQLFAFISQNICLLKE